MYDFHIHSRVSFDGHDAGLALAQTALQNGLKEICFTDHIDYDPLGTMGCMVFDTDTYNAEYDGLAIPGLSIRRGMEFGMTPDNMAQFRQDLNRRHFDFVLGSVHFVENLDVYMAEYWQGKARFQAERKFLETTLECVRNHEDFDVLAHLTFLCKSPCNPDPRPLAYDDHRELLDEILRILAAKGKGLEMNTSGVDRCSGYLPTADFFHRFRELGGEIVTIGSDAHRTDRVGQYAFDACDILKDIFGYVCTFEDRQPVFHKLK